MRARFDVGTFFSVAQAGKMVLGFCRFRVMRIFSSDSCLTQEEPREA